MHLLQTGRKFRRLKCLCWLSVHFCLEYHSGCDDFKPPIRHNPPARPCISCSEVLYAGWCAAGLPKGSTWWNTNWHPAMPVFVHMTCVFVHLHMSYVFVHMHVFVHMRLCAHMSLCTWHASLCTSICLCAHAYVFVHSMRALLRGGVLQRFA